MVEINVSKPSDSEGYSTLQCPTCNGTFKIPTTEYYAEDVVFLCCPVCGLSQAPSYFLPEDIKEQALIEAQNVVIEQLNQFTKNLGKHNSKHFKVKCGKPISKVDNRLLVESDDDFEEVDLECCNKQMKVKAIAKSSLIYCTYCGVNI